MKVDKENAGVCYNDEQHAYFTKDNESDRYTSVTTLIHKYTQEFDEEFWSGYKALQELLGENFVPVKKFLLTKKSIDQNFLAKLPISLEDYDAKRQEIKDEWKLKNQEACERGTAIHLEKELGFYDNSRYEFLKLSGDYTCVKDHFDLSEDRAIYPEYLVSYKFDDTLKIAGQIDILVKEGNEIVIGDWKTNRELKFKSGYDIATKSTQRMKGPLCHLDDCNFNHYQLQLSTYAYLLKKIHPEFVVKRLVIYHIDHDGNESTHEVKYLEDEVRAMLKDFRKKLIKEKLDRDMRPIKY